MADGRGSSRTLGGTWGRDDTLPAALCLLGSRVRENDACPSGCTRHANVRIRSAQQAFQFRGIESMAAHDRAVEEQNRDVQPIAPRQLRIGVDVDYVDRW